MSIHVSCASALTKNEFMSGARDGEQSNLVALSARQSPTSVL